MFSLYYLGFGSRSEIISLTSHASSCSHCPSCFLLFFPPYAYVAYACRCPMCLRSSKILHKAYASKLRLVPCKMRLSLEFFSFFLKKKLHTKHEFRKASVFFLRTLQLPCTQNLQCHWWRRGLSKFWLKHHPYIPYIESESSRICTWPLHDTWIM